MAKAYIAKFGAPPKPPASSDEEPNPDLLVSALPIRPEQIARFRRISPTIILITHTHTDHLDPRAIAAVRMPQTRIIIPTAARGMLLDVQGAETMANGDRIKIDDLTIEAVPMYNPKPDPQHGAIFHPKGRGNGYVVSLGGTRVYIGGDTGCTPEMQALTDMELAFVPMNLPYTMSPDEAAACVKAVEATSCLPVSLLWFGPEGLWRRVGRHRHRSPPARLVRGGPLSVARGRDLLEANRYERPDRSPETRQTFYAGLRKPRELAWAMYSPRASERARACRGIYRVALEL